MTSFHEVQFPTDVSFGSRGGPEFSTDVISQLSGFEKRNINWSESRARFDASFGVRTLEQLSALIAFFRARQGRAYGFRYKDWSDYKSCDLDETVSAIDVTLGVGDTNQDTQFQLVKDYVSGGTTYTRTIKKPVDGTVRVALNGSEVFSPATWSVDTTTGILTFVSPPGVGAVVTAGFEFDVPARFDIDTLSTSFDTHKVYSASVPIVEIRV